MLFVVGSGESAVIRNVEVLKELRILQGSDAEIGNSDPCLPVSFLFSVGMDEDVGGLQVVVQEAKLVRGPYPRPRCTPQAVRARPVHRRWKATVADPLQEIGPFVVRLSMK